MRGLGILSLLVAIAMAWVRWRGRLGAPLSPHWRQDVARRQAGLGVDLACWDWAVLRSRAIAEDHSDDPVHRSSPSQGREGPGGVAIDRRLFHKRV